MEENKGVSERNERKVCVITGGGSGMGFAAARIMGKTHYVILSGRTASKLSGAVETLRKEGISCEAMSCDVTDLESVHCLAIHARTLGKVQAVIHAAGMSPHMGDAGQIVRTNAVGTIYILSLIHI